MGRCSQHLVFCSMHVGNSRTLALTCAQVDLLYSMCQAVVSNAALNMALLLQGPQIRSPCLPVPL